jgi:hypothetical protein
VRLDALAIISCSRAKHPQLNLLSSLACFSLYSLIVVMHQSQWPGRPSQTMCVRPDVKQMLGSEGMILEESVVSRQIQKVTLLTWRIVVQSLALTEVSSRMLHCRNVWEESVDRFKQLLLLCTCVYSTLPGLRNAGRRPP